MGPTSYSEWQNLTVGAVQGLAEGQGNKDISDQLENEDQLLGASRPDQKQVCTCINCNTWSQQPLLILPRGPLLAKGRAHTVIHDRWFMPCI